jgi:hypothetical protein
MAASKSIELVLPAFALIEPYETIVRRERDGEQLRRKLGLRMTQLQRTASMVADVQRLQEASDLLLRAAQEAKKRFHGGLARVRNALVKAPIGGG